MNSMHLHPLHIFFSPDDGCYVAEFPEIKHCSAFGDSPESARKKEGVSLNQYIVAKLAAASR